ncbi:MAG TPA: hypothetical protein VFU69_15880 [Ktedonobacterales bacterium]|nr:hypothetical protein [Ktedonobacterales bacterium]
MLFTTDDYASFWYAPWAAPLRAACVDLPEPPLPRPAALPATPRWLKPLCVQRLVGKAVAERAAWYRAHSDQPPIYYFDNESEPWWTEIAAASYDCECLCELREGTLRWILGMEAERLLRIMQVAPACVGVDAWARAVLGVCEHVSQLYDELKRRHKAMRARAIVREELLSVLHWRPRPARQTTEQSAFACSASHHAGETVRRQGRRRYKQGRAARLC